MAIVIWIIHKNARIRKDWIEFIKLIHALSDCQHRINPYFWISNAIIMCFAIGICFTPYYFALSHVEEMQLISYFSLCDIIYLYNNNNYFFLAVIHQVSFRQNDRTFCTSRSSSRSVQYMNVIDHHRLWYCRLSSHLISSIPYRWWQLLEEEDRFM